MIIAIQDQLRQKETQIDILVVRKKYKEVTLKLIKNLISLITAAMMLNGCAATVSRPVLYPNVHYQKVGPVQGDVDVQYCLSLADNYVRDPDRYQDLAKGAIIGGAVGAGTGAVAGAIMKEKGGRPTAAGAAIGAIVGVAKELRKMGERSPTYQRFVEHCLQKKGYEVTSWQ